MRTLTRIAKPLPPKPCLNCTYMFIPLRISARFCDKCKPMSEAERTRRKHLVADMNLCCFRYSNGYRCDKRARRIVSHEQLEGFGVHRGLLASGPCVGMCVFHFGALERGEMSAKRKHGLIPKIEREYRAHFYNLEGEIIERMLDDLPRLKTDAHYEAQ